MTDGELQRVEAAAKVLNGGGVAIIPTDTVYGLAARPDCEEAVRRLYAIKGRDGNKPIALLVSDFNRLKGKALELAKKHWPGALTIVQDGEGYRMPDDEMALRLIGMCGGALRVTSANLSGGEPAKRAEEAGIEADYVLDGGLSKIGTPSTVVRVEGDEITILREGTIKP